MIGMVVFWAAIIVGVVWLIREYNSPRSESRESASPIEILERRFAEGAISVDDYRARREVLLGEHGSNGAPTNDPLKADPAGGLQS
jgi:putative membrane protein